MNITVDLGNTSIDWKMLTELNNELLKSYKKLNIHDLGI